jgi:hypothetical protein
MGFADYLFSPVHYLLHVWIAPLLINSNKKLTKQRPSHLDGQCHDHFHHGWEVVVDCRSWW